MQVSRTAPLFLSPPRSLDLAKYILKLLNILQTEGSSPYVVTANISYILRLHGETRRLVKLSTSAGAQRTTAMTMQFVSQPQVSKFFGILRRKVVGLTLDSKQKVSVVVLSWE